MVHRDTHKKSNDVAFCAYYSKSIPPATSKSSKSSNEVQSTQNLSNTLFSVSSDSSSVKSVEPIFALPPLPEDVPEDELVSGNYDVEFENGWRKSVSLSQLQRSGRVDKASVSDTKTDFCKVFDRVD